jgi:hypothetical protein
LCASRPLHDPGVMVLKELTFSCHEMASAHYLGHLAERRICF